jgi:hypothetical protein
VPNILVLTQTVDPHIDPVAEEIKRRGMRLLRFDFADFPRHVQLAAVLGSTGWEGHLCYAGEAYALDSIQSIWWRRPHPPQSDAAYGAATRAFLNLENLRGFLGVLQEKEHALFWVSKRHCIQTAEFKPVQLSRAQAVGLLTPRTLLTTDPQAALKFYHDCAGLVIVKAVGKGYLDPNNEQGFGEERYIYTSPLLPEDLDFLSEVRICAHLFQERVEKAMDLRVVVIGCHVFTIGIHSAQLDWRLDYSNLRYSVERLPVEIEDKVLSLVRTFGLQFSSMDFILTKRGEYLFLEMNPNGQFLWLSEPTGLPLAEAMADLLCFPKEHQL